MRIISLLILHCAIFTNACAETLWEKYIESPTSKNAAKVKQLEYTKGAIPENYGYWHPHLKILEAKVLKGDKEAFRLVVRLRKQSDGGLLQDLTAILGRTIGPQPIMFLRELSMLNPHKKSLKSILLLTGGEFVDDLEANEKEIEKRKKAIDSVTTDELQNYKQICLNLMK